MIPISFCLVLGRYELSFSFGETELQFIEELDPTGVGGDYDIAEEHEVTTGFGKGEIRCG